MSRDDTVKLIEVWETELELIRVSLSSGYDLSKEDTLRLKRIAKEITEEVLGE